MAKSIPYFPFYAQDWLENEVIFDMSLEEEGAYIRLLASMWSRGGSIPDKVQFCCNVLRCKPSKWKKIKAVLIENGCIFEREGRLFNPRLSEELKLFSEKNAKKSEKKKEYWREKLKEIFGYEDDIFKLLNILFTTKNHIGCFLNKVWIAFKLIII